MFEGVAGGPALAGVLAAAAPAGLDDWDLVEAMRGWERLGSWVAAGQLSVLAEFARRRPRDYVESGPDGHADRGDPRVPEISEYAVDEVAAALRLSRPAAAARLHVAVELAGRLAGTAAALAAGVLDVPKARAVVDAVGPLDGPLAAAVEERVLPRAGRLTAGQLRAALANAVLSVDPAAAEERHQRAAAGRQVTLRPLDDGMAELWALLPADAAVEPVRLHADVHVTVPAATALGLGDQPGELAGHGPIPASMARRLADAGTAARTWRRVTTHPTTGAAVHLDRTPYTPSQAVADLVRARDRTCRFPGCRQPAHRCDLDHLTPWPAGRTVLDNLAALCRHHHRLKHQTRWTVERHPDGAVTWTSPTRHRYTAEAVAAGGLVG